MKRLELAGKTVYSGMKKLAVPFTIAYVMAAGAACYHQWNVQTELLKNNTHKVIHIIDTPISVNKMTDTVIIGEKLYTELTPEDIAEEDYWDSLELLASCVEAEAGNQGLQGKRLVADVILNRVDSPDFPDTITEVITQPYHFSSYWDGRMDKISITDETFEAVMLELGERTNKDILYFTAGEWSRYGTRWKIVGDHYFSVK